MYKIALRFCVCPSAFLTCTKLCCYVTMPLQPQTQWKFAAGSHQVCSWTSLFHIAQFPMKVVTRSFCSALPVRLAATIRQNRSIVNAYYVFAV